MKQEPFPRRIVTGTAFCNRHEEREILTSLFKQGTHVWMQAHRRHGKTSLLLQTVEDMKKSNQDIMVERCHLLFTSGTESIIRQILRSVSKLTGSIIEAEGRKKSKAKHQTFLNKVMSRFGQLNPKVSLTDGKLSVSLEAVYDIDALVFGLEKLDELASDQGFRVILIIDEFQELAKSNNGIMLESAIRDRLETSKSLTFVFCGSESTLMAQAMTDSKRPLYNHTYPFELERISAKSYLKHLNKMALRKWGKPLKNDVIELIIKLSERHPYYLNSLCSEIWLRKTQPNKTSVLKAWEKTVSAVEREEELLFLSLKGNEKKILSAISKGLNTKMTSATVSSKVGLGSSSILKTLKQLTVKDLIYRKGDEYHIINPCIKAIIRKY